MKITKSKLLTLSLFLVLSACKNFTGSNLKDTQTQIVATYSGGEVTRQDLDYELGKLIAKNEKLKNLTFENLNSDQKDNLLNKVNKLATSQNLSEFQYNKNLNEILSSCPQYDISDMVSKKTVSDVCYGCDIPM